MPIVATKGPYVLFLRDDDMAENPRENEDCFGKMVCFHSRHSLGDKHDYGSPDDCLRELAGNIPAKDLIRASPTYRYRKIVAECLLEHNVN